MLDHLRKIWYNIFNNILKKRYYNVNKNIFNISYAWCCRLNSLLYFMASTSNKWFMSLVLFHQCCYSYNWFLGLVKIFQKGIDISLDVWYNIIVAKRLQTTYFRRNLQWPILTLYPLMVTNLFMVRLMLPVIRTVDKLCTAMVHQSSTRPLMALYSGFGRAGLSPLVGISWPFVG